MTRSNPPKSIAQLEWERLQRALPLVPTVRRAPHGYLVPSARGEGAGPYTVRAGKDGEIICDCPDGLGRGRAALQCKHVWAARLARVMDLRTANPSASAALDQAFARLEAAAQAADWDVVARGLPLWRALAAVALRQAAVRGKLPPAPARYAPPAAGVPAPQPPGRRALSPEEIRQRLVAAAAKGDARRALRLAGPAAPAQSLTARLVGRAEEAALRREEHGPQRARKEVALL